MTPRDICQHCLQYLLASTNHQHYKSFEHSNSWFKFGSFCFNFIQHGILQLYRCLQIAVGALFDRTPCGAAFRSDARLQHQINYICSIYHTGDSVMAFQDLPQPGPDAPFYSQSSKIILREEVIKIKLVVHGFKANFMNFPNRKLSVF